jgi:DtxR family Mn-dependent transcriptional regulator
VEKLSAAMEKYLKTIYYMSRHNAVVHISGIAVQMRVSKASACRATDFLHEKGLVRKNRYRGLSLTSRGERQAELICNKYKIIQTFLSEILEIAPSVAQKDAGGFGHCISLESLQAMHRHLQRRGQAGPEEMEKASCL